MNKQQGIYVIKDINNDKAYIGSTIDLNTRIKNHKSLLKNNKHPNLHLQNCFNKNHIFKITTIPVIETENIRELEQDLIIENKNTLFNIATDTISPFTGKKHSPETIAKLKEIAIEQGRKPPQSAIDNSIITNTGRQFTSEHIEKLRIKATEAMKNPLAREHLSKVNLGVKHTQESINLMKEKCKGRIPSPQAREAQLKAVTGRKLSIEHVEALRKANMNRVYTKETAAKISATKQANKLARLSLTSTPTPTP